MDEKLHNDFTVPFFRFAFPQASDEQALAMAEDMRSEVEKREEMIRRNIDDVLRELMWGSL